jgi:hypothetical protein
MSFVMGSTEPHGEAERSGDEMKAVGPMLAQQAAAVMRQHPDTDPVGIFAEAGTLEARRCRTKFEQATGVELDDGAVATVMSKDDLDGILDPRFPQTERDWLRAGVRGQELRFVVCTTNGFRVASEPIPPGRGADYAS